MPPKPGDPVRHQDYGPGRVRQLLGGVAVVDFFGEEIEVPAGELTADEVAPAKVANHSDGRRRESVLFRQSYEAINLGVVPPHPDQLINLSIDGPQMAERIRNWLAVAHSEGLSKVVFGDYGSGKSHYLRLVQAAALNAGWVVSYVEFDPKEADPAKPFLVYRALMTNLHFPPRDDGSQSLNFYDLIREIRNRWTEVSSGKYYKASPWFRAVLPVLRHFPHLSSPNYFGACNFLSGNPFNTVILRTMARQVGSIEFAPAMPRNSETAEIYVFHLVLMNEICRALGYEGLLLIVDEAEHVRGFTDRRQHRANNLFDLLARSAHRPLRGAPPPFLNEHGHVLPAYWKEGPHFGLVVGLTEGDTFSDRSLPLREACVFLHEETDIVRLKRPTPTEYHRWCRDLFNRFHENEPLATELLSQAADRDRLAQVLTEEYKRDGVNQSTLRIWVKLAALVPSIVLARNADTVDQLESMVRKAAQEACGRILPWEAHGHA